MIPFCISLVFSALYISMQILTVYAGDSGKLVAAAYTWSIAHPPGYPLYMLLGGITTHLVRGNSVAWRMGLLSSLPMALSIFFLWKSIYLITKSKIGASCGSILFGLLYPVWLYAIVPEVFGLFSLFSSLILYVFLRYQESGKIRWVYLLSLVSGLSLAHHHMIVLLLFSIGGYLWLYRQSDLTKQIKRHVWMVLALFLFGFSVYLYAPIVSSRYPPFDWEHPATITGFIRLVTRASYGTFKATYEAGRSYLDRILNLLTFFQYVLKDFSPFGIACCVFGMAYLWKQKRRLFHFFSIYMGILLFFFFYAGFPVNTDYSLGTLERFFIVPYQLFALLAAIGVSGFLSVTGLVWSAHKRELHIPFWIIEVLVAGIALTFFIRQIRSSYPGLALLKNDRTIEKLADDIFASVPEGGILSLSDDTSAFAADYSYYVLGKRQDIRLMVFPMMQFSYYTQWIRRHYPDVILPTSATPVAYTEYFAEFLRLNYPIRPILNERVDVFVPEHWVARGLVSMYYPSLEEIPPRGLILEKNRELWKEFQDPLRGILGTYRHLMLSDVLRYYADKRLTIAQAFLLSGNLTEAEKEMNEAMRFNPNRVELYMPYIDLLIEREKCDEAYAFIQSVESKFLNPLNSLSVYHRMYEACAGLRGRIEEKEKKYQDAQRKFGTPIE